MGSGVKTKHWKFGRLNTFVGVSSRWGIELTYDVKELAFAIHVLNVWVVCELWPKKTDSFWY